MNVKYNTVEIIYAGSTTYGSVNDRTAFMQKVVSTIAELSGIPLEFVALTAASTSRAATKGLVRDPVSGNVILLLDMPGTTSNQSASSIYFSPVSNTAQDAYTYSYSNDYYTYSIDTSKSSTELKLYMHYIKAGNVFAFGFARPDKTAGYHGWINMALVPVRSFSDPDALVGYSIAQVNHSSYTVYGATYYNRIKCSQFYDATKEDSTEYSTSADAIRHCYLTSYRSKLTALIPLMMGCADYYLEGVYICNKFGTPETETAIKTNDGIYLLATTYSTSAIYQTKWFANLVFDITSAAEEAM